jgi:DNA-binding winged helix-turn-helix (wHTH) protein/tetratricopeptide (TPR) repeat protein
MVSEPARISGAIKFGEGFELDLRAYELRRSGRSLKIERIPMEILFLLVEQKGQLVSREQIVERIWGNSVFLDTDNSINGAIRKIRQILKDDSEQPRFVQTITGKGYRFIAPVVEPVIAENQSPRPVLIKTVPPAAPRMWTWAVLGATVLLAAIGLYTTRVRNRAAVSKLSEKDTIVLADFVNTTGNPVFDDALKQALSVVLTQSRFLNVASDMQVSEMLQRMGRPPNDQLTREVAREVCLRLGGKAILVGSISNLGSHYVVGLQALGCAGGDMLATGQAEAPNKESVLKALDGVASQVRVRVGESLSSLEKYDFPVDTTTKSLEALKAFSMGQRAQRESGEVRAIPFFRQAIQLDPDFALAYTTLGRAYEDLGEDGEAVEDFTKAFNLRNRLSERERYYITTLYAETVTGDLERAKEAGELWIQAYPRDGVAREKLGTVYGDLGEWENANAQTKEALRLDPESTINVSNSVTTAVALNRLDEAQRILETAQALGLDGPVIHETIYSLAFLRRDGSEMNRQVAWADSKGDTEYVLFSEQSDTEAYYGRLRKARDFSRHAVESATRREAQEAAALFEVVSAFREMETGNVSLASEGVRTALSLASSRDVKVLAALLMAKRGDARVKALSRELENENPSNTLIKSYWLPTLKASLEVHSGDPQTALSLLEIAAPFELSGTSISNVPMYPAYVRGEAYLLENNGSAAAAEFKKLLDHRGIVQNSILGALSLLQLARAEVMMGDQGVARKQYNDFLSLWNDADPDIPILEQAKAEYAKLQ